MTTTESQPQAHPHAHGAVGAHHGDLGVRTAIQRLYGLDALPNREQSEQIAEQWRPYATIGSWYCWRSLEFKTDSGKS